MRYVFLLIEWVLHYVVAVILVFLASIWYFDLKKVKKVVDDFNTHAYEVIEENGVIKRRVITSYNQYFIKRWKGKGIEIPVERGNTITVRV